MAVMSAISKVSAEDGGTSVHFGRYLIFPPSPSLSFSHPTADAYGSKTRLHLSQKADKSANINHDDIQETPDVRASMRYSMIRDDVAITQKHLYAQCTRIESKLNLSSRETGYKLLSACLKCQESVSSTAEIAKRVVRWSEVARQIYERFSCEMW